MITKFKIFEAVKPEIDEKTIRVNGGERGWYIDFYYDDKNRLCYIDNKWDIKIPDWFGFELSILQIASWAKRYDPRISVAQQVYNILQRDINK